MRLLKRSRQSAKSYFVLLTLVLVPAGSAIAGDWFQVSPKRVAVTRARPICPDPVSATLGTFEPTPYIMVRGNWPIGGGYSPLEVYGDQSMAVYGPLSPLRATSAPVRTYTRGYDGRIYAGEGTSFSTPNLPPLSPVVYPTPASYYYGPRANRTPPWWTSGDTWIDQQ
jgi:hypothetical protein